MSNIATESSLEHWSRPDLRRSPLARGTHGLGRRLARRWRVKVRAGLQAFTLVEMLLAVAIIATLAMLALSGLSAGMRASYTTREVSASRTLIGAYLTYTSDNNGFLLSGKDAKASRADESGQDLTGAGGMMGTSWVHPLRPYFGNKYRSTLYINEQADYYDELTSKGVAGAAYQLACYPSFGINLDYVGGSDVQEGSMQSLHAVRTMSGANAPASLVVFVGAMQPEIGHGKAGFWRVEAPAGGDWMGGRPAPVTPEEAKTSQYGFVAFRNGLRAVVAFLDGHVELMRHAELKDMRLWSNTAYQENNPNWQPGYVE